MDQRPASTTIETEDDKDAALRRIAELRTPEPGSAEDAEIADLVAAISEFVIHRTQEEPGDGDDETELQEEAVVRG